MSESGTSRSKSMTHTTDSESSEESEMTERWSNSISYTQLVVSSCVGIVQLCWHPYLHDLRRLLPFLFAYNIFSMLIGYPLFYLELAIGIVTKNGVADCWDIAPLARGLAFTMIVTSLLTALVLSKIAAWCLALFVHSFHSFLPWLHCAAIAMPACAARHRPLPEGSETPAQSFFLNFVLDLKREKDGSLGTLVTELSIYYVISWFFIYLISCKRIYSYSKLVLFKDMMSFFVLFCCLLGSCRLDGAGAMFEQSEWKLLFLEPKMWVEALEYALLQMAVCAGSLVTLGSHCPKLRHPLNRTVLISFLMSKICSMAAAFILGATHGALRTDYDTNHTNIMPGLSSSMVLWSDLVTRIPGSQFWAALVFFAMFVLALSSTALLIQTVMSTWMGHSTRKIRWAILITLCCVLCLAGVFMCNQTDLYALNFLMHWPVSKPRLIVGATMAYVITYWYGQKRFCEDVYFAVGEYPPVFFRICWAIIPVVLVIAFGSILAAAVNVWPDEALAGGILVAVAIAPIYIVWLVYGIFKCRVRSIMQTIFAVTLARTLAVTRKKSLSTAKSAERQIATL